MIKENDIRYSRLTSLPEIGPEGMALLRAARIMVVGCGALGSLCSMYLAASGVGHVTIADFDRIDISNLQRQLFFTEDGLGESKARTLAERMRSINSEVEVTVIERLIRRDDALSVFAGHDVIIDGSDNPATKLMTDGVCEEIGRPCVIGGVRGFECQVMTCVPGSVRYSDVFGDSGECSGITPCTVGGVLGPAAGVAASIQASEAVKLVTHAGEPLTDRLFALNLLDMSTAVYNV